jgi:hypothetical protein
MFSWDLEKESRRSHSKERQTAYPVITARRPPDNSRSGTKESVKEGKAPALHTYCHQLAKENPAEL